jgi:hypothetical protein
MPLMLANVAVPVLFPQPILMIAALLLVVPVETLLLRRGFSFRAKDVFTANVYSTLWGIPVAYLVLALFGIVQARGQLPWAGVGFMSRVASTDAHHWWIGIVAPAFSNHAWNCQQPLAPQPPLGTSGGITVQTVAGVCWRAA